MRMLHDLKGKRGHESIASALMSNISEYQSKGFVIENVLNDGEVGIANSYHWKLLQLNNIFQQLKELLDKSKKESEQLLLPCPTICLIN